MRKAACLVVLLALLSQGCGVAALTAAAGYAVSSIGEKNSRKKEAHNQYYLEMQRINLERHKLNLDAEPIKTYEEWEQ